MDKLISPKITALTFGILIISFLAAFYVVAWQEPSQAPPGGNVPTPLNIGNVGQSKVGGLILNTGGAPNGLIIDKGNLCLGTDCRSAWPAASKAGTLRGYFQGLWPCSPSGTACGTALYPLTCSVSGPQYGFCNNNEGNYYNYSLGCAEGGALKVVGWQYNPSTNTSIPSAFTCYYAN